jgi:indolepyruvate ferredoxin oxidoreductase
VPEGARAYAGIGCHYMAQWMDRETDGFTQMGGEGANWIGEAPFSKRGTSSRTSATAPTTIPASLAIRAAVAAGRQHHLQDPLQRRRRHDRRPAERRRAHRAADRAPGRAPRACERIAVVSDEPDKYPSGKDFPPGASRFHHRDDLDSGAARAARGARASRC